MASIPTPNYINPPTRVPMVLAATSSTICVSFLFVSLRIITRLKLTGLGLDDILICFGWLFCFGMTFCVALSTKYGTGLHVYDIPPHLFPTGAKLAYCFTAFYNPTLMMTKSSILTFYINKLGTKKKFRRTCLIVMGYVICSSTSIFFSNIFQCSPIAGGWDRTIPGRKCINTTRLYYFSGVNNLATDLMIGLMVVFSMGTFVACVSIARIYLVYQAQRSHDYPWAGSLSSTWSAIELNVAIVCACMPAFKQFVSWVVPGLTGSTPKNSQYSNPSSPGGLQYHDSTGPRGSRHVLKSVGRSGSGTNTTTAHDNNSEEYIMGELNASSGTSGVNNTVGVTVQGEVLSDCMTTKNKGEW